MALLLAWSGQIFLNYTFALLAPSPMFAAAHGALIACGIYAICRSALGEYRDLERIDREFRDIDRLLQLYRAGAMCHFVAIFNLHGGRAEFSIDQAPPCPEGFVTEDHVPILLDLARDGDETTFRDLALSLGVHTEQLDEMWTGTSARVLRDKRDDFPRREEREVTR